MKTADRIVITGIGPITAGGSGKDKVWSAIKENRTGLVKKEYELGKEKIGEYYLHEIKDFDINDYGVNRQSLGEMESWKEEDKIIDMYYFMAVIKMALDDSGLEVNAKNKDMTGLLLAHENMGHDHFYLKVINELSFLDKTDTKKPATKKEFLDYFYKKFHRTGYELQAFMPLFHIAKIFDMHGLSFLINNACASGLYALELAAGIIKGGKCKQMVVAAVDHSNIFKQMWFKDVNMCAKDGRIKPFAKDRDGFTIGDGGAALVLETMESAMQRKADIYAEYTGGSFALEGWKITYPDVTNDFYKKMIQGAINTAGIRPQDVDLLVPHGVGTNITDKYEARAITEVFGKNAKKPVISAFKPYTGHTLGSSALLETAIMLIGLKNGKVPPTLNCEKLDGGLNVNILRDMVNADDVKIAIKTACGFAGYDGACVFRKL